MPDIPGKTDLSFCTTDELVDELMHRNETGIVCLMADRSKDVKARYIRWKDPTAALGLTIMLKHYILKEWYDGNGIIREDEGDF